MRTGENNIRIHRRAVLSLLCVLSVCVLGAARTQEGERWALLVGVEDYQTMGKLQYCAADARALGNVLTGAAGYSDSHVVVLTDDAPERADQPTLANIRRRIAHMCRLAGEEDTILLFFAGHGITRGGEGYLVPADGDAMNALSLSWVREQLNGSAARHKVLIVDACHAGTGARGVSSVAPSLAAAPGLVMLLSSEPDQISYPDPDLGHGVFTYYLARGLAGEAAGEDRQVTLGELADYVDARLRAWSFQRGKLQTPLLVGQATADLVLSRVEERVDADALLKGTETLPRGWTSDTRRVHVATAQGDRWEEIAYYRNSIGMELVQVPAGEFMMGSSLSAAQVHSRWPGGQENWYEDEHPRHRVSITRPFYVGAHEVTRGQFARFVRETGYRTDAEQAGKAFSLKDGKWGLHEGVSWRSPGFEQDDRHPVVCVSWNDATAFCRWLSEKEGVDYRLPTEAEWEYAARAGSDSIWYWGSDESGAQGRANVAGEGEELNWIHRFEGVRDGYSYTAPVGQFQPNGFGLWDVIGNVWEWCADWYDSDYYGQSPAADPEGPSSGEDRVLRGGSWGDLPWNCRSANRNWDTPSSTYGSDGFRVAVSPRP